MAKKIERILVAQTYFEAGVAKYLAGVHYEVTPDTESLVAQGIAARVTVDFDPEVDAAQKARVAATDARAFADEAVAQADKLEAAAVAAEAVVSEKLEAAAAANPSLLDRAKSMVGLGNDDKSGA